MSITIFERIVAGQRVNIAIRPVAGGFEASFDGFRTGAIGRTQGRALRAILRVLERAAA